ncbi:hypothetical protein [Novosphingobium naphthalenivorans]|uniref:hypothetical protein n=1 Tax=Novosphingobium naphthalenivorans TaxID=273168 RepID=UPI000A6905DF|nr:hypothetical protein [Novosphingobium naphthalenivorans]
MKLTDTDLQEFIAAYEADFGETISVPEAREMAARLLAVFRLLSTDPAPKTAAQNS